MSAYWSALISRLTVDINNLTSQHAELMQIQQTLSENINKFTESMTSVWQQRENAANNMLNQFNSSLDQRISSQLGSSSSSRSNSRQSALLSQLENIKQNYKSRVENEIASQKQQFQAAQQSMLQPLKNYEQLVQLRMGNLERQKGTKESMLKKYEQWNKEADNRIYGGGNSSQG